MAMKQPITKLSASVVVAGLRFMQQTKVALMLGTGGQKMANKRLIDVNEVIKETESIINFRKTHHMPTIEYEALLGYLKKRPTVDAVDVVHGYWIDSHSVDHIGRVIGHGIDCSVCDSVFKAYRRDVAQHWKERFKVCPFCGAVMDGERRAGE